MKKALVSIIWIVLLNVVFTTLYAIFIMNFSPNVTHAGTYDFGNTYGAYFSFLSAAFIGYLAARNKLPGAKERR